MLGLVQVRHSDALCEGEEVEPQLYSASSGAQFETSPQEIDDEATVTESPVVCLSEGRKTSERSQWSRKLHVKEEFDCISSEKKTFLLSTSALLRHSRLIPTFLKRIRFQQFHPTHTGRQKQTLKDSVSDPEFY